MIEGKVRAEESQGPGHFASMLFVEMTSFIPISARRLQGSIRRRRCPTTCSMRKIWHRHPIPSHRVHCLCLRTIHPRTGLRDARISLLRRAMG